MARFSWIRKVLVLGSGAIKIGEAGEFDYSGSQCLKALREEGIETVLINPNIATIQTDPRLAGKVYLLPITPEYVEEVMERERPDGILLAFGGQTALNCGVKLAEGGILKKYKVRVLGTPVEAIVDTEDRELFCQAMVKIKIPVPKSSSAISVEEALKIAKEIGYPVIVRVAYTLGGRGSGVAYKEEELREIVERALAQSMITQVLVEEYIGHWKEIEYEVMRDRVDNCITVCNMENFDPMGIHTGDSIVVAPSQTLSNREYHMLRSASIKVIRSLGIVGECNIQFALHPQTEEFRVIEVNARLSRSSALASKATGYPLAFIAAKLALGYTLPELVNKVTGVTSACFEPALDYIVVKIPRWDLKKFRNVDDHIGPQMKSVGEVMAVGRCFEEALQKAIRMLDIGKIGLVCNPNGDGAEDIEGIRDVLVNPTDQRLFKIVEAVKSGISAEEIYELSGIDPWFIDKIQNVVAMEEKLRSLSMTDADLIDVVREAKRLGFSDIQIGACLGVDEDEVRAFRRKNGVIPVVKQIDTLAAEWPAKTNYLYLTYGGDEDDIGFDRRGKKVMVLGSGVFRIGSSVEFDWCGVNAVWAFKKRGIDEAIMVNYNPETVSTDYDMSDKLYFEELTQERVLDIYEKEKPMGVVVSVGGQIPNNLALSLANHGLRLLGTSAESIDLAEDRSKFSSLLDRLGIPQPEWSRLTTVEEAKNFSRKIGYPVLIRPSYVLSGSAMRVASSEEELRGYIGLATSVSPDHPVVISKFIKGAKEVDVDGICDGENILMVPIEHVEEAGVHSGDATMSIPPQNLPNHVLKTLEVYTESIAKALSIRGPFNIQYLVKDDVVYVIECNLRASRSMPYTCKTAGMNMIDLATSVMMGEKLRIFEAAQLPPLWHVGVKVPQFSFMRLSGADPILGVEMVSTGEVACIGENFVDALTKALQSAEFKIPPSNGSVLITVGGEELKRKILPLAWAFEGMGYNIYATEHTAEALTNSGLEEVTVLYKVGEAHRKPNILDHLLKGRIDFVINIPNAGNGGPNPRDDEYVIRRLAVEFNIPVVTTLELAQSLVRVLESYPHGRQTIRSLNEYMDGLAWKRW